MGGNLLRLFQKINKQPVASLSVSSLIILASLVIPGEFERRVVSEWN